ncbi:ribosomal RNA-processing protein 8 isoform X1 [Pleurodeles waltl]|uniref:ribosomal RNA-processing protein 8 isoform X1 n=2 Tax=Pleurodeles waltl TaxID=8319 RepID=UPI0037097E55
MLPGGGEPGGHRSREEGARTGGERPPARTSGPPAGTRPWEGGGARTASLSPPSAAPEDTRAGIVEGRQSTQETPMPTMIFQEGDWNDSKDAQELTKSFRLGSSATSVSQRAGVSPGARCKKTTKRLLETLRVLESTSTSRKDHSSPAVKDTSGSEDDSTGTTPVKTKRKKKRSKRKKQALSSAISEPEPQKHAQKRKLHEPESSKMTWKRKPAGDPTQNGQHEKRSEDAEDCTEDTESRTPATAQLNRKQWKNKQKNKRRNKNKFKEEVQTGDATKQSELMTGESPATRPTKNQVATEAFNKKTVGRLKNAFPSVKKHCSTSREPSEQKVAEAVPSSNTAVNAPTGRKLQASTNDADAITTKLNKKKMEKLKVILQKQSTKFLPVVKEEEGSAPQTAEGECTEEVAESGPTVPAPADRSAALRLKMEERLRSARFRYINQQLYTSSSRDAQDLFQQDPEAFEVYHHGFRTQVEQWPENPVDLIIKYLRNRPASQVVADFGCGDCKIARSVRNTVHSFDLVALNEHVTVCDMAKVPLADESVDIAVFCLALMGTNLQDFFAEANRILKQGGVLKVAEVASRFVDVRMFLSALANMGFKNTAKDTENKYFYMLEFTKTGPPKSRGKLLGLELKACLYKKR